MTTLTLSGPRLAARVGRPPRPAVTPGRALLATLLFVMVWQGLSWGLSLMPGWRAPANLDEFGWSLLYLVGLGWSVWGLERLVQRAQRRREEANTQDRAAGRRQLKPMDRATRYYGRRGLRLFESLLLLLVYTIAFIGFYLLVHLWGPASAEVEPYELPAGGGQEFVRQTVQIRKVVRKKYVINPYSTIKFAPPPLDQIDVKLTEETRNEYQVGQGSEGGAVGEGEGEGGGFSAGKGNGKVRFIRLRHSDRSWDKNFGIGGDNNILLEYTAQTRTRKERVAEATEAIEVSQLAAFEPLKAPPLVYVCGTAHFVLSSSEKKALRDYILDKHGMVLGDNLGPGFHQSFIATMNEVTGVTPVPIPRDDIIHRRPNLVPELPIVVAHGSTVPLGWKIDGRWVVYQHPGALSDAWRDDHAGIQKEKGIYQACYQLGVNLISYAHREASIWRNSRKP